MQRCCCSSGADGLGGAERLPSIAGLAVISSSLGEAPCVQTPYCSLYFNFGVCFCTFSSLQTCLYCLLFYLPCICMLLPVCLSFMPWS